MSFYLLTVGQRCAISGPLSASPGSYAIDRATYHALRSSRPNGPWSVYGERRRTLDVSRPFTFERPVELLGTGPHVVDGFTVQCVRDSQPQLVRRKVIRIGSIDDVNAIDPDTVIDLAYFEPARTVEDVVRAKMSEEELQMRVEGLMDKVGASGFQPEIEPDELSHKKGAQASQRFASG